MNPEDPQGPSLDVFADDLSDKEHTKRFGRTVDEFSRHFCLPQNELYALIRATIDGLGIMPDPMKAALVAAGRAGEVDALEYAVNACFFGGVQRGGVYVELSPPESAPH